MRAKKPKESRLQKYAHYVDIEPIEAGSWMRTELYVSWKGHKGRHGYLIAADEEDLDILITELGNALNNYRRKKLGL